MTDENAIAYGLVGPIARASGVARDIRKLFPYAAYGIGRISLSQWNRKATATPVCASFSPKRSNRPR